MLEEVSRFATLELRSSSATLRAQPIKICEVFPKRRVQRTKLDKPCQVFKVCTVLGLGITRQSVWHDICMRN